MGMWVLYLEISPKMQSTLVITYIVIAELLFITDNNSKLITYLNFVKFTRCNIFHDTRDISMGTINLRTRRLLISE